MGTVFRIEVADQNQSQYRALEVAQNLLQRVEQSLSDWSESSELRQLEKSGLGRFQQASPLFIKMLRLSYEASEQSAGLFDITIGDTLWLKLPTTHGTLNNLQLKGERFKFVRPPKRLTFGGIAKGYAVGQLFDELSQRGFAVLRVDGGGGNAVVSQEWLSTVRPDIRLDSKLVILANSRSLQGQSKAPHIVDPKTSKLLANESRAAIACRFPSRFDAGRSLGDASALADAATKSIMMGTKQNTAMKILDCIDIMPQWPAKAPQTQQSQ
jgi:hypothetical protein